ERGLAELLIHLEHQRVPNLARGEPEVGTLQRELADLKQIDKKTQDTLEAVHGTLGHVVDRLAMIESDVRKNTAPVQRIVPATPPRPAAATARPTSNEPAPAAAASAPAASPIAAVAAAVAPQPEDESAAAIPAAPTNP